MHSGSSEPTLFPPQMPEEHPPTPPPSRWPAIITLLTLATLRLVWRRLCDVVLFPSCLVEQGLLNAPLLICRVSFSSHSSCTLYSSASSEGPTLSSFLRPASRPPSSFVRSVSLPSSFPASHSPSVPSSFPVDPPSFLHPGGSGRVAKQSAGMPFPFYSSIPTRLVHSVSTTASK